MPIHINVMAIVPTVLPTMDIVMVAGTMDMVISMAVSVVVMAVHPAGHIGINHYETWY